jgi:hypothetical protein
VETGYGIGWSIDTSKKTVFSAQGIMTCHESLLLLL